MYVQGTKLKYYCNINNNTHIYCDNKLVLDVARLHKLNNLANFASYSFSSKENLAVGL